MPNLLPLSQQQFQAADGSFLIVSIMNYVSTDTFDVDASAVGTPVAYSLIGGTAPTCALGTPHGGSNPDNPGLVRLTMTGGAGGKVMVITRHIGNASAVGAALKA